MEYKLRPEDLRIGNLLRVVGTDIESTIDSIGQTHLGLEGNGIPNTYDQVEPIPLSSEWLERLGFEEKDSRGIEWEIIGIEYPIGVSMNAFSGTLHVDPDWFVSIKTGFGSNPVTINVKYVHQLQNLYYALSGEDLSINLNVKG